MTTSDQTLELIAAGALLEKVGALRQQNARLVQISTTRLLEQFELTYSFELADHLVNLRLNLPAEEPKVTSITSIYWCAFLYENEMHDLFGVQVDGIAVDFKGNFYRTSVKHAFGRTKLPAAKTAPAADAPALPKS